MTASSIRVLVAEDFPSFRRYLVSRMQSRADFQVVCEVGDGSEAVQKARVLQPDLILLDIGLPGLNGIEAAREIRSLSPSSKILFISENHSPDIVEEALHTGALGFVVKSDAASDLFPAVTAVLEGKEFVSIRVSVHRVGHRRDEQAADLASRSKVPLRPLHAEIADHHKVVFYSEDRQLLDEVSRFVAVALNGGNAAIVIATESHRDALFQRLQAYGLEILAAIEQGRYVALDAADAISSFIANDVFDSTRFLASFGTLILKAANAAKGEHPRVALFGEGVDVLLKQAGLEVAIQDEKLCNQLTKKYDVDILCGYLLGNVDGGRDDEAFQRICAEHSAVYCA